MPQKDQCSKLDKLKKTVQWAQLASLKYVVLPGRGGVLDAVSPSHVKYQVQTTLAPFHDTVVEMACVATSQPLLLAGPLVTGPLRAALRYGGAAGSWQHRRGTQNAERRTQNAGCLPQETVQHKPLLEAATYHVLRFLGAPSASSMGAGAPAAAAGTAGTAGPLGILVTGGVSSLCKHAILPNNTSDSADGATCSRSGSAEFDTSGAAAADRRAAAAAGTACGVGTAGTGVAVPAMFSLAVFKRSCVYLATVAAREGGGASARGGCSPLWCWLASCSDASATWEGVNNKGQSVVCKVRNVGVLRENTRVRGWPHQTVHDE